MKKETISWLLIGLSYIGIGLAFSLVPSDYLLQVFFFIVGAIIIISNAVMLMSDFSNLHDGKKYIIGFISSIIFIFFGFAIMFIQNRIVLFIIGGLLLCISLYNFIISKNRKKQLELETSRLFIGVICIILGFEITAQIVFKLIGILFIISGAMYLLCSALVSCINDSIDAENELSKIFKQ